MPKARQLLDDLIEGKPRKDFTKKPLGVREMTSKAWILPDDRVVDLTMWHDRWLEQHAATLKKKFKLDVPQGTGEAVRLWALNHGFTRINYEHNGGRMTVETNRKWWTKKRRDSIWMFIFEHVGGIDNVTVNVLDDKGRVVKQGYTPFGWLRNSPEEKMDSLPLINEGEPPLRKATDIGTL